MPDESYDDALRRKSGELADEMREVYLRDEVTDFIAAGVELGFLEVVGRNEDGEPVYGRTPKADEVGKEEVLKAIGRLVEEREQD